ncbi:WXG100 family type VII secretion target [uncultured Jatrophihabitans sp.]|uniref:WXG100 family type VII secretion target n=1 Tax=uncultured Jatrophihabitans sp. TaxID=1610747 RepID=UPI0035CC49E3
MSYGVDTDAMQRSAGQIGVAAEQIDTLLGKMRADVNTMLEGWSGGGAAAHRSMHARFEADVVAINTNLRQMQAALQQTHALYLNQENAQNSDHIGMRNTIAQ